MAADGTTPSDPNAQGFQRERRFVLQREEAETFIVAVEPHVTLEVYDRERPIAYTRTTYLDTDDLEYFRTCDTPVASRLRVREYAAGAAVAPGAAPDAPTLTGICFLELKVSCGPVRTKARFSAPPYILADIVEGADAVETLWGGRLAQMEPYRSIQERLRTGQLSPKVTTWYHRASLAAEQGRVRLTLDEGIAFCRPVGIGAPGAPGEPAEAVEYGPGRLLEVKYWGEPPEWLVGALAGLAEETGYSKFKMGILAMQRAEGAAADRRSTGFLAVPGHLRVREK